MFLFKGKMLRKTNENDDGCFSYVHITYNYNYNYFYNIHMDTSSTEGRTT